MAINEHPPTGTILRCNFDSGFRVPEMVKTRPVVVISPKISVRHWLCTVVPIGTERPQLIMPYHYELTDIDPPLPPPYQDGPNWVKGDMIVAVSFERLDFLRYGKDRSGKRVYRYDVLPDDDIRAIRSCVEKSRSYSIDKTPAMNHIYE